MTVNVFHICMYVNPRVNIVVDILLLYLHHIYTHVNPIFRPVEHEQTGSNING